MRELLLRGVSVRFGRVQALKAVDLRALAGEVLMLAGPNGAGKSTLLSVLLGLVRPDAGALLIDGRCRRVDRSFKATTGYLPEAVAFAESLTGRQVGRFFAAARGVPKARVDAMLERVGLAEAGGRAIRGYSRGMRQRLGLGLAILHEPALLLLDEPTGGLDQEGLSLLWSVLEQWRRRGRVVVLSSHDLSLLERRVQRICVLRSGEVLADATPEALRRAAALRARVSLTPRDEGGFEIVQTALAGALSGRAGVRVAGQIVVEVRAGELMALLEAATSLGDVVADIRVAEPGLDEVYEHLLATGPLPDLGAAA